MDRSEQSIIKINWLKKINYYGRYKRLLISGITYREAGESGYRFPSIEAGIKYLKPVHYDYVITIKTLFGRKPGVTEILIIENRRDYFLKDT